MPHPDAKSAPLDRVSADRLAADGLELRLVDTDDVAAYDKWLFAVNRGFLGPIAPDADAERNRQSMAYRRTTGVYDPTAADPDIPIATVNSWVGELTVPGERLLPSWAISCVTVAPTYARRGIARALIEAELRTAVALGVPMAMLTVSESQLYGRYGFGCAVFTTDWVIETKRVNWIGPTPAGRVEYITVEDWRDTAPQLHDRVRLTRPGDIDVWPARWDQIAGLGFKEGEAAKRKRAVRYTDEAGETRGTLLYHLDEDHDDFTKHTLVVDSIIPETPDAYAALWRYALQHPLVATVKAWLLSSDEPLRWMIDDMRAVKVTEADHQYLRPLDVAAVLSGRSYPEGAGPVAFEVTDALGVAEGMFVVEGGTGRAVAAVPDGVPVLRLGPRALGALHLGGVSAATLTAAGQASEATPGAAIAMDALLTPERTPYLSVWY